MPPTGNDAERLELEDLTGKIARTLQEAINTDPDAKRIGFCLLMFDFGDGPGSFAYAANARRADVVKLLKEAADKVGRETQ